jgi:GT2 family glycosyltransferase
MAHEGPSLSIVMPSFNRADALPATLLSLARQSLRADCFEVIVVDDGSTDSSVELVRGLQAQVPFPTKLIQRMRGGPGAARNQGARVAEYDVLLFWDSDMVADSRVVEIHAALHTQHDAILVAGARRPWPRAYTTTFARTMNPDRDQFDGKILSFQEVFSCNLSIRRSEFWSLGGFDESLRAFEDADLAYRAQQAGLTLVFARDAIGYHNHPMTLEQACQHQRRYQRHAALFLHKHPELEGQIQYLVDKEPLKVGRDSPGLIARKTVRRLVASRGVLGLLASAVRLAEARCPNPKLLDFLYWKLLASYQLTGYREGLKESGQRCES